MTQDLPLASASGTAHSCGCGKGGCGGGAEEVPSLDVRLIPREVRHAAVLGALGAVAPGGTVVLLAPHDPIPLMRELSQREPGAFAVSYDQEGPDTWAVRLTRVGQPLTV